MLIRVPNAATFFCFFTVSLLKKVELLRSKLMAADAKAAQDLSASEEKSATAIAELNEKIEQLEVEVSTPI